MSVRAKFFVQSITPSREEKPDATSRQIVLGAVCRGAANREWASATPGGGLTMTVRNDAAIAQFVVGQEYYLDFTPAEPKPAPADGHPSQPGPTPWNSLACEVCGAGGSWDPKVAAYVWDDAAEDRHQEMYGSVPAPA